MVRSRCASWMMFDMLAIVPPLIEPFVALTYSAMLSQ